MNSSRTENVYEALKGDIDDKSALENSLCTKMATTKFNVDDSDSEGTYEHIKNWQ